MQSRKQWILTSLTAIAHSIVVTIWTALFLSMSPLAAARAGAAPSLMTFDRERAANYASPERFAIPLEYRATANSAGTWSVLDGFLLWQHSIDVTGALSVSFRASSVRVPAGGALFVDGVDQASRITKRGTLWSSITQGQHLEIEAWIPADRQGEFNLEIDQLQAGFRIEPRVYAKAAATDVYNVACYLPELDRHSRATLNVSVANVGNCSGVLVNNTHKDQRPFVLTAAHCGVRDPNRASGSPDYSNLDSYDWDAAAASIQLHGDSITPCGQPIVVSSRPVLAAGAEHRVVNGDMWLIEMDEPLPANTPKFFAGIDARTRDFDAPHPVPASQLSSVSHSQNFDQVVARFERAFSQNCIAEGIRCWTTYVTDETVPAAQPGSSGSALFDADARVSGTVFGGLDDFHVYQQVAISWNVT
ncbi:MAG: hypothetical protein M3O62_06180, partial [Pseudomonadota bacterium]|nr:hypothetical protein [Pseudomonadota bacterium]